MKFLKVVIIIFLIILISLIIFIALSRNNTVNHNEVIPASDSKITASTIANEENKNIYYGKIVSNYDCINSDGVNAWQIFYADENNIYLIADDYISYEYCPKSKTQEIIKGHNSDYRLSMQNVVNDYTGAVDIVDEKIKMLNSDYFNKNGSSSTSNSMKAIAYMLDTEIWSVYAGESAEFAIASPTIELFLNSYNDKYNANYKAKSDELGYRISKNGGETWDAYMIQSFDPSDNLYITSNSNNISSLWLASPSCISANYLMRLSVGISPGIFYDSYDSTVQGFRPVVCLKNNIYLEEQENGTFIIKY